MDNNKYKHYFFQIKIRHINCWTSMVPDSYKDLLLGYFYSDNILKAIRISKYLKKSDIKLLKTSIKHDQSVRNINIYNMDNISSIVEMDVDYENAFLDKLIKKSIFPLKSSISDNCENYIFTVEEDNVREVLSNLNENIEIINIKELEYTEVISELSHSIIDIFLTEKQINILKLALNNNFFSIPRGTSNKLLAQQMSISKMAFNIEIRKTVNKIINKMYS